MQFLINGSTGYLGSHLFAELSPSLNIQALKRGDKVNHGDAFIHCAYFSDIEAEKAFIESLDPSIYLVFLSSSAVYGEQNSPVSIDSPCKPISPYGLYKLELESLIRTRFEQHLILGISNPYGKENKVKGVSKIFEDNILSQKDNIVISLDINADHPQQIIRDFIYIDDFVSKTCNLICEKKTGIHNISSGIGISLEEQAIKVFERLKQENKITQNAKLKFNYKGYKLGEIKNSILV